MALVRGGCGIQGGSMAKEGKPLQMMQLTTLPSREASGEDSERPQRSEGLSSTITEGMSVDSDRRTGGSEGGNLVSSRL